MNKPENLRKTSRRDFDADEFHFAECDELKTGALQRIADALEVIVKSQDGPWESRALDAEARLKTEKKRTAGLRGQIKKLGGGVKS